MATMKLVMDPTIGRLPVAVLISFALLLAAGVAYYESQRARTTLIVSTTTSLYDTGLLDKLSERFVEKNPAIDIRILSVGTGEALRRVEMGDACVTLVHAPSLEKEYIEKGVIAGRRIFAYDFFIIAGPASDPANISGLRDPVDAFRRIYKARIFGKALFVSRGDLSGTHIRELAIWKAAGLDADDLGGWYIETGQGMGETLVIASEKRAYVLTDIGTYLMYRNKGRIPNLEILVESDYVLLNIYSAYISSLCSGEQERAAKLFVKFLMDEGQEIIGGYGVKEYGAPLFYPSKGRLGWLEKEWARMAGEGH